MRRGRTSCIPTRRHIPFLAVCAVRQSRSGQFAPPADHPGHILQRGSVDTATELWLRVAQEDKVDLKDPGVHILCTFLLGQTQSAHCERVFARVVEMQTLVSRRTTFPSLERWMPGRENKLFAA